jgi:hypothetical protein
VWPHLRAPRVASSGHHAVDPRPGGVIRLDVHRRRSPWRLAPVNGGATGLALAVPGRSTALSYVGRPIRALVYETYKQS